MICFFWPAVPDQAGTISAKRMAPAVSGKVCVVVLSVSNTWKPKKNFGTGCFQKQFEVPQRPSQHSSNTLAMMVMPTTTTKQFQVPQRPPQHSSNVE